MAVWYCSEVLAGRVPACKYEVLACKRFLEMRGKALSGKAPFVWSDDHAVDVCDFIEKLPHAKGFDGTIVLEPVQCFWISAIFAFREKDTLLRWVRSVRLWVPRKNGKTALSVGVVLYCCNFEGEVGAEAVISAGSEAQANIPYGAIRATLLKDIDLAQHLQATHTRDGASFSATGAEIKVAHSRAKNLDGLNPHVLLQEELHAQDQDVIGVLKTAQGARRSPLDLGISTAGRDVSSAAYEDWKNCVAVLEGRLSSPRLFTVMYAGTDADKDRKFDLATIEKLNPLYGVALNPVGMDEEIAEARKSESKLQEYLRTRLNLWTRAAGNLISIEDWARCSDPKLQLEFFKGFPIYVGIDLASRQDLNAAQFITKVGDTIYSTARYWICEKAPRLRDDRFSDDFFGWHRDGHIKFTPGAMIDYRVILADIFSVLEGHNVVAIAVDDYQANLMATEIEAGGYQVFIVRKTARQLTQATEDIIARVADPALFQHDGNPITEWCAGNVVGYWDSNDNVLPKKEKRGSKSAIDGMDALIEADALRLDHEAGVLDITNSGKSEATPYLRRGLIGWSGDAA